MTPSELKAHVEANSDSHFFDRKTMKFFGDTMRNYGVRLVSVSGGENASRELWELYRKSPVKHGVSKSAYFCPITYKQVFRNE